MFEKLFFGSSGRLLAVSLLLAATLSLPGPLVRPEQARHTYLIETGEEPIVINGTAYEAMDYDHLHVRTNENAVIHDAQLLLRNGQTVVISVNGEETEVTAGNETVDHLLRRTKVNVADDEMVVLDVTGDQLVITVTDVWERTWEKVTPTSYTTERVANPALTKGKERVKQAGQDGEYVDTYSDVYRCGELQRTVYMGRSEEPAVNEIIEYGTAASYVESGDRIAEVVPAEDGSGGGYLVFTSGATMPYTSVDTYNATAYDIHGITATGYPTEIGVVAVDPKVIPYGTRMFIQTPSGSWVYGMAVARDCGGAIKGKIIDLWFPDYETCCKWGRRDITVYFLG